MSSYQLVSGLHPSSSKNEAFDIVHACILHAHAKCDAFKQPLAADRSDSDWQTRRIRTDQPIRQHCNATAGGNQLQHEVRGLDAGMSFRSTSGGGHEAGENVQTIWPNWNREKLLIDQVHRCNHRLSSQCAFLWNREQQLIVKDRRKCNALDYHRIRRYKHINLMGKKRSHPVETEGCLHLKVDIRPRGQIRACHPHQPFFAGMALHPDAERAASPARHVGKHAFGVFKFGHHTFGQCQKVFARLCQLQPAPLAPPYLDAVEILQLCDRMTDRGLGQAQRLSSRRHTARADHVSDDGKVLTIKHYAP